MSEDNKNSKKDPQTDSLMYINRFIEDLQNALTRSPPVRLAIEKELEENNHTRSYFQIAVDDVINAFISGMNGIPDEDIPVNFYSQLMKLRAVSNTGNVQAQADMTPEKALEGINKQRNTQTIETEVFPESLRIMRKYMANPKVMEGLIKDWFAVLNSMTILTASPTTLKTSGNLQAQMTALSTLLQEEYNKTQKPLEEMMNDFLKKEMGEEQAKYSLSKKMGILDKMKDVIQEQLKEMGEDVELSELDELEEKIKTAGLSEEAREHAEQEFKRLKSMPAQMQERNVIENYLNTLVNLPWDKRSELNYDTKETEDILEEDHYGLEKVKDAIADHVSVFNYTKKPSGTILCFIGPPGVGKTSIGKSIAKATNREFVRMSLGGLRDESEIRGHRSTYVGAKAGRIIQALQKAKTKNPVIMLDEIDKLGSDTVKGGDPSSAMLEVLDPEQNDTFRDNYLGVDFDLSEVMFVTTANYEDRIEPAVLDRMEVIRLSGYTQEEKFEIAKRHLIKKQMDKHGLTSNTFEMSDDALRTLIVAYTHEAGVRTLEREIGTVCRKAVREITKGAETVSVTEDNLETYAGPQKERTSLIADEDQVGYVHGLYYSVAGGGTLPLAATVIPVDKDGRELDLQVTGNLADVMKESVSVARTVVRNQVKKNRIVEADKINLDKMDVHVHTPDGSTPKDGPSAGAAFTTAVMSAVMDVAVRRDVAMTGTITLHGRVGAIGGLDQKLDGASRDGSTTVLVSVKNEKDLQKIAPTILSGLNIMHCDDTEVVNGQLPAVPEGKKLNVILVRNIEDVFKYAMTENILSAEATADAKARADKARAAAAAKAEFKKKARGTTPANDESGIPPAKKKRAMAKRKPRTLKM